MAKQASVHALLHPRNVVLVGASDRPGHWSGRVWSNLKRLGFKGGVYAVNPGRGEIWGARCYPDLATLPEPPDHLAIFVPADTTLSMLEAGARLGVRGATLYAAGFGEGGDAEGRTRAERLRVLLRDTGIAAAGPNCMGLGCGRSGLVTLADETLQPLSTGPVAVLTQSGMLATTFARTLADRGIGVSHLISCGNQTGLTLADYVAHLADDADVRVITGYIEMIPEADRFFAACAKARAKGKSVVVVKIGGSESARAAALAHTGSMVGSHDAFDAVARTAGVVRATSLEEAIEAAELLSRGPSPAGPRVALMTNSGALKTLMTEAAERHGVQLARLSTATEAAIRSALGPNSEPGNPLDTKATLPTDTYMACIDALGRSGDADLVLTLEELPREAGVARKVRNLEALDRWAGQHGDGRAAIAMLSPLALADTAYMKELRGSLPHLPMLRGLDTTFRMLARLATVSPPPLWGRWPVGPDGDSSFANTAIATSPSPVLPRVTRQRAPHDGGGGEHILEESHQPRALSEPDSKRLLASAGIRLPREEVVATPAEVLAAARRMGFPVVMKAVSAAIAHKSDAGLVLLDIDGEAAAVAAAATLASRVAALGAPLEGILVADQVKGGVEMVLGVHRDPEVGPVLMVGLGGVWLEVMRDVAFTGLDITREDALEAIRRTKAWRLMDGFRGAPRRDVNALAEAMVALGALAARLGDGLESIDINPIVVLNEGQGALALDALVVLRPTMGGYDA
jgi:acyl-CoA synthetase (NDP forming)